MSPESAIDSVRLAPDQRTVFIYIDSDSIAEGTNLAALQISDDNPTTQYINGSSRAKFIYPLPVMFPLKINNGGAAYADYLADQEWGPMLNTVLGWKFCKCIRSN